MKIECLKEKIKEALNITERIAGRNLTLPILEAVLIEAKNKTLILKSTNLEVGVEIEIPAKVDEEGIIAVKANILSNFISNLNNETKIQLETINNNLKITTERTNTLIKGLNNEDFPIIPKIEQNNKNTITLNSTILVDGLKAVIFSASINDIKPEISSVYIYNKENELFFVATDSFRLAEKKILINNLIKEQISLIIPIKNITEIIKTIENLNTDLLISFNKNQIIIQNDNFYLTSRIIDGSYPDYQQIIPNTDEFKTEFSFKKEEFLNILKLSNIFTDKFNQIDLIINSKNNTLEIKSYNQEIGENKFSLVTKIKGESLNVSFNSRYLIDCLPSIESTEIKFLLIDKNKPLLISSFNDNSFNYLVMPINKSNNEDSF